MTTSSSFKLHGTKIILRKAKSTFFVQCHLLSPWHEWSHLILPATLRSIIIPVFLMRKLWKRWRVWQLSCRQFLSSGARMWSLTGSSPPPYCTVSEEKCADFAPEVMGLLFFWTNSVDRLTRLPLSLKVTAQTLRRSADSKSTSCDHNKANWTSTEGTYAPGLSLLTAELSGA